MATCDKLKGEHPQYKESADSLQTPADLLNASSHFVNVVPAVPNIAPTVPTHLTPANSNINLIHDENHILLQTARACVKSVDDKHSANLRILFDGGSQLSYIYQEHKKYWILNR